MLTMFLQQQIGDDLNKKGIHEMNKNAIMRYEQIVASWAHSLVWGHTQRKIDCEEEVSKSLRVLGFPGIVECVGGTEKPGYN